MIKTAWQKPAVKIAFWMTFSAIGFGCLMGLFRFVGQDLHVFVMSFWRFVFSFLLFLPWAMRAGPGTVRSRRMGLHVLRACFLIVASTSLITATLFMPLDEVTALSFTTPLFSVIGAVLFLRERAGLRRWLVGGIAFPPALIIGLGETGTGEANPCLKGSSGGAKPAEKSSNPVEGAVKGVGDAVKGVGEGVGGALKGLFGK